MVNDTTNLELEEQINLTNDVDSSLDASSNNISFTENNSDAINASSDSNIEDIQDNENQDTGENNTNVNCLALTVKKDYSLSIVKHVFVRTWKTTWRVALSIFVLNFLSFFF